MLSNHYPLAFATEYNWLIASLVFLMGVTIRHYFNTMHAGKGQPNWTWAATAIIFVIIMWLSSAPGSQREELATLTPMQEKFASAAGFSTVADTVRGRCSMCHTAEPGWPGVHRAPKGVILETDAADRGACAGDLPAGGPEPCDAAGERLRDRAEGAQGDRGVVSRCRVGGGRLRLGSNRSFGQFSFTFQRSITLWMAQRTPNPPAASAKPRYRVTNWHEYNRALVARGAITLWIDEEVLAGWRATGSRGLPYSDAAILCALGLRMVFRLPLRQLRASFSA